MKKLAFVILLFSQIAFAQDSTFITPGKNLTVEGIPPIPSKIASDIKRYTESRSSFFVDWHPTKREMLMTTRFANVNQLHQLTMPMGMRKQLTFYDEPVSNATYEPQDGRYFVFTKDIGGNEFGQLYRYDLVDGRTTLLTEGGRSKNENVTWNPTGEWITYNSTRRNGTDRDCWIMKPMEPNTAKLLAELPGGAWKVEDWSPDGKSILLAEDISVNEAYLWLLDVMSGKISAITDREIQGVFYGQAKFSADGNGIWYITDIGGEYRCLAYMDIKSYDATYITRGISWDVEEFDISEDGKKLAFSTNEAGISKLYLMDTATKKYMQVNGLPAGIIDGVKFDGYSNNLAMSVTTSRSPSDIYVFSTNTMEIQRWTESEMGGLVASELSEPALVRWKSFDGLEISGFMYPASARFTGKRPVMIIIHGGPEGQSRPNFGGFYNYYTNELGITLIFPNVRGSAGYGKTYLTMDNGLNRENSVKDIGALLDWIKLQPGLDADRILVSGGSYGGYMSLAVSTTYADRIRCAIDVVGISNFNTFLKNTEGYRRELRRAEYGDEREPAMAAFFEKIAPLNNAAKITKPLMIVQGANDPRVPRTEAVQMAEKVRKNGKEVWYLEASDEGHGFSKKNNVDFQRYVTVWFMKKFLLE